MKTVVQFPDIDWINHPTRDKKGHFQYARGYLDLVLEAFTKDLQKRSKVPVLFEGEELAKENEIICAKQAVCHHQNKVNNY